MITKKDYSELCGCWIDSAVPRNNRETAERLSSLATHLKVSSDWLAHEDDDMSEADTDMWLEDVIYKLDCSINEVLSVSGFAAVWESGDYVIFQEEERI